MSTSIKRLRLFAKNATIPSSNKHLLSEKPQDSLQDSQNRPTSQYPFLNVENADTLMENSYQRKLKISRGTAYDGLHEYD
jgi:hypothetical protein